MPYFLLFSSFLLVFFYRSPLTQLAIGTIGAVVGGIIFSSSGKKAEKPATPVIQAGSSDEEKFIANFLKEQEAQEKH